jgi:patatin-like phospholipase/acyl hydrolase
MIKSILSISILFLCITKAEDHYFNILSLDGAGMNGIMTAKILSMIEEYAYNYAEDKGFLKHTPVYMNHKIIPIKDLFNMTAATSVTSFLAVGLSIPSSENATLPAYTA